MKARVVVMIPAHNEEASIEAAIASVQSQADRVYVVADNCTDGTVGLARAMGATVLETEDNRPRRPARSTRRWPAATRPRRRRLRARDGCRWHARRRLR